MLNCEQNLFGYDEHVVLSNDSHLPRLTPDQLSAVQAAIAASPLCRILSIYHANISPGTYRPASNAD